MIMFPLKAFAEFLQLQKMEFLQIILMQYAFSLFSMFEIE